MEYNRKYEYFDVSGRGGSDVFSNGHACSCIFSCFRKGVMFFFSNGHGVFSSFVGYLLWET